VTVGSREPATRRRQDTRTRIVQSALELFGRDGFDHTTVKAIADRCGLSDAALYYHFRSKRAILDSLWETSGEFDIDPPSTRKPLDQDGLARLAAALIENCASHDSLLRLIVRQVLAGDRTAIALRNQTMAQWRTQLLPHFEMSLDKESAAIRVDALTMLVLGLVFTAQITHGDAFCAVAESDEFLSHAAEMARIVAPLRPTNGA
jgi:AcrR family transcriptional regulator